MSIIVYYKDWVRPSPGELPCISLAQNLNHDVLYTIFGFLSSTNDRFASQKDIIVASKVCRRWRETAIDTPRLWTYITLNLLRCDQEHLGPKTLFIRSRRLPVHLQVYAVRPLSQTELAMLASQASRLRTIDLLGSSIYLMHFLVKEFEQMARLGSLRNVRRFEYEVVRGSGFKFLRDPSSFVAEGDNRSYFPPFVREVALDWSSWNVTGLTSLVLHHVELYGKLDIASFRNVLFTCSNTLQSLTWMGYCPKWDASANVRVALPVLQDLYIGHINDFSPLLGVMDAVSLKSCTIHNIITFPDANNRIPGVLWHENQVDIPDMDLVWEELSSYQLTHLSVIGEKSLQSHAFLQFLLPQGKLQSLALYEVGKMYHKAFFDPTVPTKTFLPRLQGLMLTSEVKLADLQGYFGHRLQSKLDPLGTITTTPQTLYRIYQAGFFHTMGACTQLVTEIPEPCFDTDRKWTLGAEKTIMSDGKWAVSRLPSTHRYLENAHN